MIDNLLQRLKLIEETPELHNKFRKIYGSYYPMVEACIKEDLIKDSAIKFINNLTDEFLNQKPILVDTRVSEGIHVNSVEYIISNDTKRIVLDALKTIRQNPYIENCEIDGSSIWGTVKQFMNTIDDELDEIEIGDTFEFRSDVQRIIIGKNGDITLKAYSKWNDDSLTFELK